MSGAPEFGVNVVGKKFVWNEVDDDGEITRHEFRARGSIPFEEVLEYRTIQAELQVDGQLLVKTLSRSSESLDGEAAEARPIEDLRTDLTNLAAATEDHERRRWARIIDQTIILVHPPHRDPLRDLLEVGDYNAVTDLRTWLIKNVINKAEEEAEVVGAVDPTLPPPPPNSPDSETGGDDSDPKESSSTD